MDRFDILQPLQFVLVFSARWPATNSDARLGATHALPNTITVEPASQTARIRGLTLVGQALAFRAARALSLLTLEVENLGATEIALITAAIRENIRLLQYA